jgi:hypothetical protein
MEKFISNESITMHSIPDKYMVWKYKHTKALLPKGLAEY